jgi:methyl-accepting chemotaxis protein
MTIRKKISLFSGGMLLVTVILIILSLFIVQTSRNAIKNIEIGPLYYSRLGQNSLDKLQNIEKIYLEQFALRESGYNASSLDTYSKEFLQLLGEFSDIFAEAKDLGNSSEVTAILTEFDKMASAARSVNNEYAAGNERAASSSYQEFANYSIVIHNKLNRIVSNSSASLEDALQKMAKTAKKNINIQLLIGFFVILFTPVVIFITIRTITQQLSFVSNVSADLAEEEGDLTIRINNTHKDEIGVLSRNFDKFLDRLRELIQNMRLNFSAITKKSQELNIVMDETYTFSSSLAETGKNIEDLVNAQEKSVEAVASSVNQINGNIATQDEKISEQAVNLNESSAAVEQMVANIRSINRNLESNVSEFNQLQVVVKEGSSNLDVLKQTILKLEEQSESVVGANKIISSISAQTNLLAMNAAIEAAHAGENGKGFAVVADEIRKLAETSAAQTKVIRANLDSLNKAIDLSVQLSDKAGSSYSSIIDSVKTVVQIETEVETAMSEQSAGTSEVLIALKNIGEITEAVHSGSESMMKGSSLVLTEITNLEDATSKVRKNAEMIADQSKKITSKIKNSLSVMDANNTAISTMDTKLSLFKTEKIEQDK